MFKNGNHHYELSKVKENNDNPKNKKKTTRFHQTDMKSHHCRRCIKQMQLGIRYSCSISMLALLLCEQCGLEWK